MYELAHVVVYGAVYLGAALTRTWKALLLYAAGAAVLGYVAGASLLQHREQMPGRGGWDALGDAILMIFLGLSLIVGLLFHIARLAAAESRPALGPWLLWGGLILSPIIGIGGFILISRTV